MTIYIFLFSGGTASFDEEVEDEEDEEKSSKATKHIPTLMNLKYGAVV